MAREGKGRRSSGLDQPLERGINLRPEFDGDTFGRFAETFARFMGTARFLVYMTVFIIVWITINVIALFGLKWDPYPFILLNLIFSTQASYAAPLILLAQNRQADRDRIQYQEDRKRDERLIADTEYLTRELAALRMAVGEVATRDYLRGELRDLVEDLADRDQKARTASADGEAASDDRGPDGRRGRRRPKTESA
jgi:uncharacterized membrane protein